jgi:hypothetical protein
MEQIARVEQFRKAWVERKSAEEVKSAALIKSNTLMKDFLGLKQDGKQATLKNFLKDRECSVSIWKSILKRAASPTEEQAAKEMVEKEEYRLEEARRVVNSACGVNYV